MLSNAYLLAKFRFDTAENERNFAEILPKTDNYAPTQRDPPSNVVNEAPPAVFITTKVDLLTTIMRSSRNAKEWKHSSTMVTSPVFSIATNCVNL